MVRVSDKSGSSSNSAELGNGRGSPSDVFSSNILQMETKKKEKNSLVFARNIKNNYAYSRVFVGIKTLFNLLIPNFLLLKIIMEFSGS